MVKSLYFFSYLLVFCLSITSLQEAKAGIIAKGVVLTGVAGCALYSWSTRRILNEINRRVRTNGEGIIANQKALGLLRRDVGGLKKGQQRMHTELQDIAYDWQKGQERLENGQTKLYASLGSLDASVIEAAAEFKQGQEGRHREVCKDLNNIKNQWFLIQTQQKEISYKQDEILKRLDGKHTFVGRSSLGYSAMITSKLFS